MARDATRRRVLAIGAVTLPLAVAGCKGLGALGSPPKAAPGVAVVGHAITVETRLIAHYGAVLAAVPPLAVPGTPAAALGSLRDAEDAAAAAQLAHLAAAPPSLAQLLASISASEATHALILDGHRRHR